MKPFKTLGKAGLVLVLLNEIRGILVVTSILGAWSHAGRAAAPPEPPCATAPEPAPDAACRRVIGAKRPAQAATAPPRASRGNAINRRSPA